MRATLLSLLAVIALAVLALWAFRAGPSMPPTPAPNPKAEPLVVPGNELIETRPVGGTSANRGPIDPQKRAAAYSFEGTGTIRGHIGERGGAVFPREWDLVLEPHPYLEGRERAESRRIQLRAGERDFKVENLRLGGYLVRAEANGLNSSAADVLLVKGSHDQFVELAFSPSGWLDGSVLDAQGAPAEGIEVRLADAAHKTRFDARTDPAGAFEFRALLDGDYEISFRAAGCEFGEPRLVSFRAPRLSFPAVTLPATGTLEVLVLDLLGKPAANVRVTGFGKPKGALDLVTDAQGIARLKWCLPGHWELRASDEAEGLSARGEAEVEPGALAKLPLRLVR